MHAEIVLTRWPKRSVDVGLAQHHVQDPPGAQAVGALLRYVGCSTPVSYPPVVTQSAQRTAGLVPAPAGLPELGFGHCDFYWSLSFLAGTLVKLRLCQFERVCFRLEDSCSVNFCHCPRRLLLEHVLVLMSCTRLTDWLVFCRVSAVHLPHLDIAT